MFHLPSILSLNVCYLCNLIFHVCDFKNFMQHLSALGIFFFFLFLLGLNLWPMEVSRLGVESELQLPHYTTATAMQTRLRSNIAVAVA